MKIGRLVEEIGDTFKAMDLNQFYAGQLDQVVESAIARIGEIALSGECADLDKLLGVVRREHGLNTFIDLIDGPLGRREELTYIAFRPPGIEPGQEG